MLLTAIAALRILAVLQQGKMIMAMTNTLRLLLLALSKRKN
jgi:hypothetical protein